MPIFILKAYSLTISKNFPPQNWKGPQLIQLPIIFLSDRYHAIISNTQQMIDALHNLSRLMLQTEYM